MPLGLSSLAFLWLSLTLPAFSSHTAAIAANSQDGQLACALTAGALLGAMLPVLYESGAHLLYPLPEANSACLLGEGQSVL